MREFRISLSLHFSTKMYNCAADRTVFSETNNGGAAMLTAISHNLICVKSYLPHYESFFSSFFNIWISFFAL